MTTPGVPLVHILPGPRGLIAPVVLLLTTLMIAGCLGGSEEPEIDDEKDDQDQVRDDKDSDNKEPAKRVQDINRTLFTFPLEQQVHEKKWFNGSFEPQETGLGGGFVTGGFQQTIDLSDLVPPEVPTHVSIKVTMDAETVPIVGPTARADPASNGTVWYERDMDQPGPGQVELTGIVKRSHEGTFAVVLEAYTPGSEDPTQMRYSVEAVATAEPEPVPRGVPVAIRLKANETLTFESERDSTTTLLIYGPDDEPVDRLLFLKDEQWVVPDGMEGEFVLIPLDGTNDLRIGKASIHGPAGEMRALGFTRETGTPHAVEPRETIDWTFEVDPRPLRVSIIIEGPAGEPWACSGTLEFRLDAPQQPVFELVVECASPTNVPFLFEEQWAWSARLGDTRLVPGTYEASVTADLWYGQQAYHVVEWYKR